MRWPRVYSGKRRSDALMQLGMGCMMRTLLASVVLGAWICTWASAAPLLVNYEGVVGGITSTENPVAIVEMEFRLWSEPESTDDEDFLWGRRYEVRVEDGRFGVILGSEGLPDKVRNYLGSDPVNGTDPQYEAIDLALARAPCWVGITVIQLPGHVGEGQELSPRQPLLSVPHALGARRLVGSEAQEDVSIPVSRLVAFQGHGAKTPIPAGPDVVEVAAARDLLVRLGAGVRLVYRVTVDFTAYDEVTLTATMITEGATVVEEDIWRGVLAGSPRPSFLERDGSVSVGKGYVHFDRVLPLTEPQDVKVSVVVSGTSLNGDASVSAVASDQVLFIEEAFNVQPPAGSGG